MKLGKRRLIALLLSLNAGFSEVQRADETGLLKRIVLIGASATAGMDLRAHTDGAHVAPCALAPYLEAALNVPPQAITNVANRFFFLAPSRIGRAQIDAAIQSDSSLVVGVDFLFWFLYGDVPNEETRFNKLAIGLKELQRIKVPLVIGDIPDASRAAYRILSPSQIPEPATISTANKRIEDWAAAHTNVTLIDLATFMREAVANRPLRIHKQEIAQPRELLQQDQLHPTARGAAVLALAILDKLSTSPHGFNGRNVLWDIDEVFHKGAIATGADEDRTASSAAKDSAAAPIQAR